MNVNVDWRAMFAKYAQVVAEQEGTDFLTAEDWTEDEWAAINALVEVDR